MQSDYGNKRNYPDGDEEVVEITTLGARGAAVASRGQGGRGRGGRGRGGRFESGRGESGRGESGRGESGRGESGRGESGRGESAGGEGAGEQSCVATRCYTVVEFMQRTFTWTQIRAEFGNINNVPRNICLPKNIQDICALLNFIPKQSRRLSTTPNDTSFENVVGWALLGKTSPAAIRGGLAKIYVRFDNAKINEALTCISPLAAAIKTVNKSASKRGAVES